MAEPVAPDQLPAAVEQRRAYNKRETASLLGGIHTATVDNLIRDGSITPIYVGGRVLFTAEEIDRFLADASRTRTHRRGQHSDVARAGKRRKTTTRRRA